MVYGKNSIRGRGSVGAPGEGGGGSPGGGGSGSSFPPQPGNSVVALSFGNGGHWGKLDTYSRSDHYHSLPRVDVWQNVDCYSPNPQGWVNSVHVNVRYNNILKLAVLFGNFTSRYVAKDGIGNMQFALMNSLPNFATTYNFTASTANSGAFVGFYAGRPDIIPTYEKTSIKVANVTLTSTRILTIYMPDMWLEAFDHVNEYRFNVTVNLA